FQAEDGIRDGHVTGVQTCALPILLDEHRRQTDPVDRQAVIDLRTGNAEAAVQHLAANGRVALANTADAAREQMVDDWLAAHRKEIGRASCRERGKGWAGGVVLKNR